MTEPEAADGDAAVDEADAEGESASAAASKEPPPDEANGDSAVDDPGTGQDADGSTPGEPSHEDEAIDQIAQEADSPADGEPTGQVADENPPDDAEPIDDDADAGPAVSGQSGAFRTGDASDPEDRAPPTEAIGDQPALQNVAEGIGDTPEPEDGAADGTTGPGEDDGQPAGVMGDDAVQDVAEGIGDAPEPQGRAADGAAEDDGQPAIENLGATPESADRAADGAGESAGQDGDGGTGVAEGPAGGIGDVLRSAIEGVAESVGATPEPADDTRGPGGIGDVPEAAVRDGSDGIAGDGRDPAAGESLGDAFQSAVQAVADEFADQPAGQTNAGGPAAAIADVFEDVAQDITAAVADQEPGEAPANEKPPAADEESPPADEVGAARDEQPPATDGKPGAADGELPASDEVTAAGDEQPPEAEKEAVSADEEPPVPDEEPAADNEVPPAPDEESPPADEVTAAGDEQPPAADGKPGAADGELPASDEVTSAEEEEEEENVIDRSRADHVVAHIPPRPRDATEVASTVEDIIVQAISQSDESSAAGDQSSIFKETGVKPDAAATTGEDAAEPAPPGNPEANEVPPIKPPSKRDGELDALLNKMIRQRILPDPEDRIDVVNYGRKKSAQLLLDEEYDAARDVDLAVDLIFVNMHEEEKQQDEDGQSAMLKQRLEQCKTECQEITQGRQEALESKRAQLRERIAALEKLQEEERQQLEREWSDPRAKIPYSKPSPALLQVRQKQKAFALLHDFENAKAMKKEAESLERQEAIEGAARYAAALRIAWAQLLDRQQKEMECLTQNSDMQYSVLNLYMERELWRKELTKKSLELRLSSPKHKKRPTIQVPVVKARGPGPPTPGMITHRTRSELQTYRKAPETRRLELRTEDAATLARTSPRRTTPITPFRSL
jgi:hypothetical protein